MLAPVAKRVMIADDEDDIRLLLRMVLLSADYTVVGEAASGDEALEVWKTHRDQIQAVILDQRMPGLSGLDVARAILGDDPDQKIILCSAHLNDSLVAEAAALGIVCLPKSGATSLPDHDVLVGITDEDLD